MYGEFSPVIVYGFSDPFGYDYGDECLDPKWIDQFNQNYQSTTPIYTYTSELIRLHITKPIYGIICSYTIKKNKIKVKASKEEKKMVKKLYRIVKKYYKSKYDSQTFNNAIKESKPQYHLVLSGYDWNTSQHTKYIPV